MDAAPLKRVGYWWSEKKSRKLNANRLKEVCLQSSLELIKINLEVSLEEQGPFVAIVHKLSDFLAKAQAGQEFEASICNSIQNYEDNHPEVVFIDPLQNVDKILNRYDQYILVQESELAKECDIFIPTMIELKSMDPSENLSAMKSAGIEFPVVCKPLMGHGFPRSHQMSIIFNEEGLSDVILPCVVQKFINHNAVLYKIFAIGDEYYVIERPSLKNFFAGDHKTVFFDSNNVSKPHSVSELTKLDNNEPCTPVVWPEKEKMEKIVCALHNSLKLNLVGIDVVLDNTTGHYAIIDINIFPGYLEAPNFYTLLTNMITREVHHRESGSPRGPFKPRLLEYLSTPTIRLNQSKFPFDPPPPPPTMATGLLKFKNGGQQEDSGIETSDSCDEKKSRCEGMNRTRKYAHSKVSNLKES